VTVLLEVALIKDLNFVAHLLENKMVEESVMCNNGLNLRRNSIDMTEFLKINAQMHIVGNLMIWQALTNV
jgi:mannose/cellobiose epimerase-like protein (N-acyl-D-glucosamine 2-epimerase family)